MRSLVDMREDDMSESKIQAAVQDCFEQLNNRLAYQVLGYEPQATTGMYAPEANLTLTELEATVEKLRGSFTVYYIAHEGAPATDGDGKHTAFTVHPRYARGYDIGSSKLIIIHPDVVPDLKQIFKDTAWMLKPLSKEQMSNYRATLSDGSLMQTREE